MMVTGGTGMMPIAMLCGRQTRAPAAKALSLFHIHSSSTFKQADYMLEQMFPPFRDELYDFYRTHFSKRRSRRFIPSLRKQKIGNARDSVYILRQCQQQNSVVAALRLTLKTQPSSKSREYIFLQALCVSQTDRRKGLALRLMREAMEDFRNIHASSLANYYCFASPDLRPLYQQAAFVSLSEKLQTDILVPKWIVQSYTRMADRQNRKKQSLDLFVKLTGDVYTDVPTSFPVGHGTEQADGGCRLTDDMDEAFPSVGIVLLQHINEKPKKTATGWLLNDEQYNSSKLIKGKASADAKPARRGKQDDLFRLSDHMSVTRWTWSGRDDNARINKELQQLVDHSGGTSPILVWTGGSSGQHTTCKSENYPSSQSYIILDGTWQEAKSMYRKIPDLWKLPRLSLSTDIPSIYTLRKDYTGWRQRFGDRKFSGADLLCTAEVAAAIMDRAGKKIAGNAIRARLKFFQDNFHHSNQETSDGKK